MYRAVVYRDLYPGIDAEYRVGNGWLKSEFHVAAGADPRRICFRYSGAGPVHISREGRLVIPLPGGEVTEEAPVVYQLRNGRRSTVDGSFSMRENGQVGFTVGAYDKSVPLIIDPTLSYSTLIGGSGFDRVTAVAVDTTGAAYVTGYTDSYNLPSVNPFQHFNGGGDDVFVAKLSASGNTLIYCTYLGGTSSDRAYGIAVDAKGSAYVTGSTASRNFPVSNSLQPKLAGETNAFVAKLSPAGNSLVFATYLGGNARDVGNGIAVDSTGNVYVVGDSTSLTFPTTGLQRSNRGSQDAFVAKISADGSRLLYGTYLGGAGADHGAAIAVDTLGRVFVAGGTDSLDFPTRAAFQANNAGGQDAFILAIAADGGSLLFSTYLGGSGGDTEVAQGIALDGGGGVYVAGITTSPGFPVKNPLQPYLNGWGDAFVAKFDFFGALVYSTFLGGSGLDAAQSIAVDATGNAYIAGYTYSTDLPVSGALQGTAGGDSDAFVAELSGTSLVFLTYLGGSQADAASAIALDGSRRLYIAGWTQSQNFPFLNGYQQMNSGNFGGFLTALQLTGLPINVGVTPSSGAGTSQLFSFQFSDENGATKLSSASVLFNTGLSASNGCVVIFGREQNTLELLSDAGTKSGLVLTPGSGTQQNSRCVLSGTGSTVTSAGQILTVNLSLSFKAGFAGALNVYMQAVNPYGTAAWQLRGSWTVPTPVQSVTSDSVTPSSGSALIQTFAFQYSDTAGGGDLSQAWVWINAGFSSGAANSCMMFYSKPSNGLLLLNDSGGAWSAPAAMGTAGTLGNSQCTVNLGSSSWTISGTHLILSIAITFKSGFAGAKNIYLYGTNGTVTSGWQTAATWTVPASGAAVVAADSITPSSGSGAAQTFAVQYSDTNGGGDLTQVWLWINASFAVTAAHSCMLYYSGMSNGLVLLNDDGATWSSPATLAGPGTLGNSQCSVNLGSSSVATSGTYLILTVSVSFTGGYAGAKNMYAYATNGTTNSAWQTLGAWSVPAGSGVSVTADSVTPASGTGSTQAIVLQYSDTNGGADLTHAWFWINASFSSSASGSCMLYYSKASNGILLLNDAASAWSAPGIPGNSAILSNSQCSVNLGNSSVSISGPSLVLNLTITYATTYAGAKNIYAYATNGVLNSGWRTLGAWTVPGGAITVTADSATPNTGSGSSRIFTLQYSDSDGAGDLTQAWLWINATFGSVAANSCMVYYSKGSNGLSVLDDAGNTWSPPSTIGSAGNLGNRQCSVNLGSSSVGLSGTHLVLTLAMTFTPGYGGLKNLYAYATNGTVNSGWQLVGNWSAP